MADMVTGWKRGPDLPFGVVTVWCGHCLVWSLSGVVTVWCDHCLVWSLSGVVTVWCDHCLV